MKEIFLAISKNLKHARLTYLLFLYCFIVFAVIQFLKTNDRTTDDILTFAGAPLAIDIYNFQFWGIVTNSFVHHEWVNFVINTIGLILLGSYVERRVGVKSFFFFGLFASTVSSAFQLAFSDDAGIGLSGVNYALFGFVFTMSFIDSRFKIVTKHIALLVMLLFIPFCEYMNQIEKWNIATLALLSGFIVGILVGLLKGYNFKIVKNFLILLLFFSLSSLFYTPWSAQWNCAKGIKIHEKGNIELAKKYYQKALTCDYRSICANDNLRIIKIDELSAQAFKAHSRGKYLEAHFFYEEILKIDSSNSWAKNNLKRLP